MPRGEAEDKDAAFFVGGGAARPAGRRVAGGVREEEEVGEVREGVVGVVTPPMIKLSGRGASSGPAKDVRGMDAAATAATALAGSRGGGVGDGPLSPAASGAKREATESVKDYLVAEKSSAEEGSAPSGGGGDDFLENSEDGEVVGPVSCDPRPSPLLLVGGGGGGGGGVGGRGGVGGGTGCRGQQQVSPSSVPPSPAGGAAAGGGEGGFASEAVVGVGGELGVSPALSGGSAGGALPPLLRRKSWEMGPGVSAAVAVGGGGGGSAGSGGARSSLPEKGIAGRPNGRVVNKRCVCAVYFSFLFVFVSSVFLE